MWRYLLHPSTLLLIAGNLVPLFGVIFWGWDAFVLMMLYWLETAVIAFWMVTRIAMMPVGSLDDLQFHATSGATRAASSLGLALFFTLHAGIFMGVHFLFLWDLFSGEWSRRIYSFGAFVDQLIVGTGLWLPLLVLFVMRGALMLYDIVKPRLWRRLGLVEVVLSSAALTILGASLSSLRLD